MQPQTTTNDYRKMNDLIVLNLGHARTVHHWRNEDISSPFFRLFYVKSGRAVLHLTQCDIEMRPGYLYLLPSYTPHAYECEPEFDFFYLFVYQKEMDYTSSIELYDLAYEIKANDGARLLFEHYCMLYPQLNLPSRDADAFLNHKAYHDYVNEYMKMEVYERMQLHGMAEILLSYFVKYARPKEIVSDKRIAAVLEYVQQHLNQAINVEQLADLACMTKSHLIRTFRQSIGITPLQYVIRKKIQFAQTLLLSTEMSINEIAQSVGIDDTSYFIRFFKKNIGFTPQEYRLKLIG